MEGTLLDAGCRMKGGAIAGALGIAPPFGVAGRQGGGLPGGR
ncbi:hypothetical protein [Novosphingobium guangzhouense]|nr:hypothetical protein [Novosphingobium guangzhouense]